MIVQLLANGIVSGCVFATVALGFSLIFYTTKIFHFAHGIVFTASAYLLYTSLKVNVGVAVLISLGGAILFGILIEKFIYQPLVQIQAPDFAYMISSLGLYIFFENLIAWLYGNRPRVLTSGAARTYSFGSVLLTSTQLLDLIVSMVVLTSIFSFLRWTHLGRTLRAIANDPYLAQVVGINVKNTRICIFAMGSALAAVGAMLISADVGIEPTMGIGVLLVAVVAVIVGGGEIVGGAVLGGLMLGLIQNLAVWKIPGTWQELLTFLILIVFLLFRPRGILGKQRRTEEL